MSEKSPPRPSIGERWAGYRPSKALWFWSCVGCVTATLIVGFTWGGWTTQGSAVAMAKSAADQARDQLVAAVCVQRFESAPDAAAQLALLKKTEIWEQADLIAKGGWVTLPGLKEPVTGAADLCVQKLMTVDLGKPATGTSG